MKLFVDCEFNGFGGDLISMALVSEDGREWYEILPLPDVLDPWVAENVIPVLGDGDTCPEEWFREGLHHFLRQFDNPVIVADWYTDLVHFFSAFEGIDHSESIAFDCRAELITNLPGYEPETPHNALSDARAIRDAYLAQST